MSITERDPVHYRDVSTEREREMFEEERVKDITHKLFI
jgi:hypothetical protein